MGNCSAYSQIGFFGSRPATVDRCQENRSSLLQRSSVGDREKRDCVVRQCHISSDYVFELRQVILSNDSPSRDLMFPTKFWIKASSQGFLPPVEMTCSLPFLFKLGSLSGCLGSCQPTPSSPALPESPAGGWRADRAGRSGRYVVRAGRPGGRRGRR